MPRGTLWPALTALLVAVAFLLGFGVQPGSIALFAAYQVGFVALPGCLAFMALDAKATSLMRILAFGWTLGYVLSVLSFVATAAIGARELFLAYPILTVVAVTPSLSRRGAAAELRGKARAWEVPRGLTLGFTATFLLAMTCFALALFVGVPIPGTATSGYFPDYIWHIALSADALHQWPIMDPHAAGAPEPYHFFVHVQIAAVSQVTGLSISMVYLRLLPLALFALLLLQVATAARQMGTSRLTGVVAMGLAGLVADLQMNPGGADLAHFPFLGASFSLLYTSPSQLFGLIVLIPLLVIVFERVRFGADPLRAWLMVGLLAVGGSLAKVMMLPLILATLALYGAWRAYATRRPPLTSIAAFTLIAVVMGVVYIWQFRGHSSAFALDPFVSFSQMPAVAITKTYLSDVLGDLPAKGVILGAYGVLFGLLGLTAASLAGVAWLPFGRRFAIAERHVLLAAFLLTGLGALLLLGAPGSNNQFTFFFIALVPGSMLAAEGLVRGWRSRPRVEPGDRRLIGIIGGAWLAALAALIAAPSLLGLAIEPVADARSLLLWYGGLLVLVIGLAIAVRFRTGLGRWGAAAACTIALLLVGSLDVPFAWIGPRVVGSLPPQGGPQLTPGVYRGLSWVRDEVPFEDVVAVNTDSIVNFYTSAFSEHRVFIEGWLYSATSVDAGSEGVLNRTVNPFADRLEINGAAFQRADRGALERMYDDYGVRYLVIDRVNGYPVDEAALLRLYPVAFENADLLVLRMDGNAQVDP